MRQIGNFGGAYCSNDKLKNIITQGEQIIERKGFDSVRVNEYNNFVGLSNNDWPWKIECGDRRHLVLEVSNAKVGDKAYFDRLALCFNDECVRHFYNMLLRRDISYWSLMAIPTTDFKRDLKLMSAPIAVRYMVNCVRSKQPTGFSWTEGGPTVVFSTELYARFQQWQREVGDEREKLLQVHFVRSLGCIGLHTMNVTICGQQLKGFKLNREQIVAGIQAHLKDEHIELDFQL
jgi:hypothetical protein